MANPLLSIVLIARESTMLRLKHTLDSALKQTYEPKNIWVINANPADATFTQGLLENLKRFPQVHMLPTAGKSAEFHCRNLALQQAGGDYIAFMSDMDMWEPDKALRQIARLDQNLSAGAVFCNALMLRETRSGIVGSALFERAAADMRQWMLDKTVACGSQVMYRASALQAMGGFDEQLSVYGDLDVLARLSKKMDVLVMNDLPVKVHVPPQQDLRARQYADNRYLLSKHIDFFLLHKKAMFDFLLILAQQAADNRKYHQTILYLTRAVLKRPLRSALLLVRTAAQRVLAWLRRLNRRLIIRTARIRLCAALRRGNLPQEPRPGDGKKRRETTALDQLREYEFVRFADMKFMRNQTLEYVKVPDYVTVIPQGMFFGCRKLHTVEIPATVTRIEANAFQGCERLKSARIAKDSLLESIGDYAFAGCVSLPSLTLSNSLAKLGRGAFAGCANLRGLTFSSLQDGEDAAQTGFPSSIRTIPPCAFSGCVSMTNVLFQPGSMLETIGSMAFYRCAGLETLKITGTVRTLGAYALAGCTRLMFLDMQTIDSIRTIGRHAFEDCQSMKNLYIPHAVKYIRPYTFRGCLSLKRVKIPQGVHRIGRRAFYGCKLLETVTLMDDTTAYQRSSFPKRTKVEPYRQTENG